MSEKLLRGSDALTPREFLWAFIRVAEMFCNERCPATQAFIRWLKAALHEAEQRQEELNWVGVVNIISIIYKAMAIDVMINHRAEYGDTKVSELLRDFLDHETGKYVDDKEKAKVLCDVMIPIVEAVKVFYPELRDYRLWCID